jgi:hypothetical protein
MKNIIHLKNLERTLDETQNPFFNISLPSDSPRMKEIISSIKDTNRNVVKM